MRAFQSGDLKISRLEGLGFRGLGFRGEPSFGFCPHLAAVEQQGLGFKV